MKTTRRGFIKGILGASAVAVVAPTVFNAPKPEKSASAIMMQHGPTIGDVIRFEANPAEMQAEWDDAFERLDALRESNAIWYEGHQWSDPQIKVLKMRIHESHVSPKINRIRKVKL